jgi:hypothetical protein
MSASSPHCYDQGAAGPQGNSLAAQTRVPLYDDERSGPSRPEATEDDPERAVARRQIWPGSVGDQYGQLLSQDQVLNDEVTT